MPWVLSFFYDKLWRRNFICDTERQLVQQKVKLPMASWWWDGSFKLVRSRWLGVLIIICLLSFVGPLFVFTSSWIILISPDILVTKSLGSRSIWHIHVARNSHFASSSHSVGRKTIWCVNCRPIDNQCPTWLIIPILLMLFMGKRFEKVEDCLVSSFHLAVALGMPKGGSTFLYP